MSLFERARTLQRRVISTDSLVLVGLRTLSKFLLLVFVLLCARLLAQDDFGDFQFVDTLTVQALQLLVVASMVVSRVGCRFPEESQGAHLAVLHRRHGPRLLAAGVVLAGIGAAADPFMRASFNVSEPWCFAASGITVGAYLVFSYCMGIMQVQERFKTIGALFLVMGVVPLVLATGLFRDGATVLEAYAAVTTGTVAAAALGWLLVARSLPAPGGSAVTPRLGLGFAWLYLAVIGLFLAMHNMDIWTTKFFLGREAAGYYARFEFVGKIIFMISSCLTIVLFPKVGKAHERGCDPRNYLARGLKGFALLTCAFSAVILGLFHRLSPILFGEDLSTGLDLLTIIIVAKAAQSLMFILINYEAARVGRGMLLWVGATVALEAALFALLGTEPFTVACSAAAASVLGAAALTAHVWKASAAAAADTDTPGSGACPEGNEP